MEHPPSAVLAGTGPEARQSLLALLALRAYRHGHFTLASGRNSSHYVNCKPVSLSGSGLVLLGSLMLEQLEPETVAVAGLTLGADPLVSAVALCAALDAVLAGQAVAEKQRASLGCNIKWKAGDEPEYYNPAGVK